jgi:hypothetical protein
MAISTSKTNQEILDAVGSGGGGFPLSVLADGFNIEPNTTSLNFSNLFSVNSPSPGEVDITLTGGGLEVYYDTFFISSGVDQMEFYGAGVEVQEVSPGQVYVTVPGLSTLSEEVLLNFKTTHINFEGAGVTATETVPGFITVTIPGSSGGSDLIVEEEGSPLSTAATKLNFIGAGVTVTEPVENELTITIPGGGSSGGGGSGGGVVYDETLTTAAASITLPVLDYYKTYDIVVSGSIGSTNTNALLRINADTTSTNYEGSILVVDPIIDASAVATYLDGQMYVLSNTTISNPSHSFCTLSQGKFSSQLFRLIGGRAALIISNVKYLPSISAYTSLSIATTSGNLEAGTRVTITERGAGGGGSSTPESVFVKDKTTVTTSSTATTWNLREYDTIIGSTPSWFTLPTSSTFTLGAGTYELKAKAWGLDLQGSQLRLYNVTASSADNNHYGIATYGAASDEVSTIDELEIYNLVVTSTTTFRIEHYSAAAGFLVLDDTGLGIPGDGAGLVDSGSLYIRKIG